jgi:hypothetical protein
MTEHTYAFGDRVRHARDTEALGTVQHASEDKVWVQWDIGPLIMQTSAQIIPYVRSAKERVEGLIKNATTPFIAVQVSLLEQIRDDLDLLEEYKVHPLLTQLRREIPNEHTFKESPDA